MSAENVIVPDAFKARIDKDTLDTLKASGAVSANIQPIDKIELPEVGYGDHVLGTLTDEECELFCLYHAAAMEYEDLGRAISAGSLTNIAEAIRNKTEDKFNSEGIITDEQAAQIFRAQRKTEYLKQLLYFSLCEKYNCHEYIVGVRKGRRFVKNRKQY